LAGFFQQVLKGAAEGFFETKYLKDYSHASKTFLPDAYAYAPKFKWLFHVYFSLNDRYIEAAKIFPQDKNFGLAVKNIQLPKYSFQVSQLNQYNRKRHNIEKITYDPVTVTFHDDNNGLIRKLWYAYYSYNIGDPDNAKEDSKQNIYSQSMNTSIGWGYKGSEPSPPTAAKALAIGKIPFFDSIEIYGFNQHNFALYELINPVIESFNHDTYDYSQTSQTMEHSMTFRYEYVKYYEGALNGEKPQEAVKGFADTGRYDRETSPISRPGSTKSILGQGGLLDTVSGVSSDLQQGNFLGAIQKIGAAKKSGQLNIKNLKAAATTELSQVAIDQSTAIVRNTNFAFPVGTASSTQAPPATLKTPPSFP